MPINKFKTIESGILQYTPTGMYYARTRIKGVLVRQSLGTYDLREARKVRMKWMTDMYEKVNNGGELTKPRIAVDSSWIGAVEEYLKDMAKNPTLSPASLRYYRFCFGHLGTSWKTLPEKPLKDIYRRDCQLWAQKAAKSISATFYNNIITQARLCFDFAARMLTTKSIVDNPWEGLPRLGVKPKRLTLPEPAQFQALLQHLRSKRENRWRDEAAWLVEFLAYSGLRISEAANVKWKDIDLVSGNILVSSGKARLASDHADTRRVPLISAMRELLTRHIWDPKGPEDTVIPVKEAYASVNSACDDIGVPRLSHHDFRHLFATKCIESGVDIPTVSRWLGHVDGGTLAMKTYGHLRDSHSQEMAAKVNF